LVDLIKTTKLMKD